MSAVSGSSSSSDFVLLNGQEETPTTIASSRVTQTPPTILNLPESQDQGYFQSNIPHTTVIGSQSGYRDVTASTLDAATLEFVSTGEQSGDASESRALGDTYTGSLDTEGHEQFAPRQRSVASRLLNKQGFGWLMEVEEDEDEQQKPLL